MTSMLPPGAFVLLQRSDETITVTPEMLRANLPSPPSVAVTQDTNSSLQSGGSKSELGVPEHVPEAAVHPTTPLAPVTPGVPVIAHVGTGEIQAQLFIQHVQRCTITV